MTKNTKHTGASLMHTPMTCPAAVAVQIGFTEEQATRIVRTRQVLPYAENRTEPNLDARKLWERIGKPEGRFDKWTARGAGSILGEFAQNGGALEILTPTGKRPRIDYKISRDCAAHLAMLARTPEGASVRSYFLDVEELAVKLVRFGAVRGEKLAELGNKLHSLCIARSYDLKKLGRYVRADDLQADTLRAVCRALTGHRPSHWQAATGRPFRDNLDAADLDRYVDGLVKALALFALGDSPEEIEVKLGKILSKAERIDPRGYATRSQWATAVAKGDDEEPDDFLSIGLSTPKAPAPQRQSLPDTSGITDF